MSSLPTYCPSCRSIRQPNGSFCHVCGYSFVTKELATTALSSQAPSQMRPRVTIGDGFRFGLGFMVAFVIFWLIVTVVWAGVFAAIFGSLFGGLGR